MSKRCTPTSKPGNDAYTISGYVTDRKTGKPYARATVEFEKLGGGNIHTTTDGNGFYSVQLQSGFYTAIALDLNNVNEGFDVIGRATNDISVPPPMTIDFVAYKIVS